MLLAVLCFGYAGVLGWLLDPVLARGDRSRRAPRAWLWVRHATAAGTVLALVTGALLLAHDVWEHALTWALHAEKVLVHAVYEPPREPPGYRNVAALVLVILVTAMAWVSATSVLTRRRGMRDHRLLTACALSDDVVSPTADGSPDERPVTTLVASAQPAIYCVSRRRGRSEIVVTSGAAQRLSRDELEAALAHEEAHLRGRHHAMVLAAEVCSRALSWTGALRHHAPSVRLLVEQAADDEAARRHGPLAVASALLALSTGPSGQPSGPSLAMSGPGDAGTRIRRLLRPRTDRPSRGGSLVLAGSSVLLAGLPLLTAVAPAIPLVGTVHAVSATSSHDAFPHHP